MGKRDRLTPKTGGLGLTAHKIFRHIAGRALSFYRKKPEHP